MIFKLQVLMIARLFVNDEFIGGYQDFIHLYSTCKLHAILQKHNIPINDF